MKSFPLKRSELSYWIFRASQLGEIVSIVSMAEIIERTKVTHAYTDNRRLCTGKTDKKIPVEEVTCEKCKIEMHPLSIPDWMIDELIASTKALIEEVKDARVHK